MRPFLKAIITVVAIVSFCITYEMYGRSQLRTFYTAREVFLSLDRNEREDIVANGFFYVGITPAKWPENARDIYRAVKRHRRVTVIIMKDKQECMQVNFIPGLSDDGYLRIKVNSLEEFYNFINC